jgi:hypothetical protein
MAMEIAGETEEVVIRAGNTKMVQTAGPLHIETGGAVLC